MQEGSIVAASSRLQSTGAHVMWLHHTPLDAGERMRGHGSLLGAIDTTINAVKGDPRTATIIKANDAEEGQAIAFRLTSVTIGTDANGDTTAPVVEPAEPTARPSKVTARKLPDSYKLALDALTEATLRAGQAPPVAFGLPGDVRAVDLDVWREEMFRRGVLERNGKNNPREAFKRMREGLAARKLIGIHFFEGGTGLAWRVSQVPPSHLQGSI